MITEVVTEPNLSVKIDKIKIKNLHFYWKILNYSESTDGSILKRLSKKIKKDLFFD